MLTGPQVLVFPSWRDNPFLNLMQLAPSSQGYQFIGATTWKSLLEQMKRLRTGDVLHMHWTTPIIQSSTDEAEAEERLRVLKEQFGLLAARGVSVVWTLHNRLPHETRYRELEIDLYRLFGEVANVIHVMNPDTADVVADLVRLDPGKVRIIPHPSYAGVYESGIDRARARDSFDLGESELAALFFGQIRPYKGVDVLVEAAGRGRPPGKDLVLMLAGVVKDVEPEVFLESLPQSIRTVAEFGFVPDSDLARWFMAADIAVFPYRQILNSGSIHLAATFHVPVIIPDEAHLRVQFGDEEWVEFFDPANPSGSIAQLLSRDDLFAEITDLSFREFTEEISPWKVSRQYFEVLEQLEGAAVTSPGGRRPRSQVSL